MEQDQFKRIFRIGMLVAFIIAGLYVTPKMFENVDGGEIVVIQDPIDGEQHVYKESGMVFQGMGKVTIYKKSNQFWFLLSDSADTDARDNSIDVMWNDGAHAKISGSVRYDMPLDDKAILKIHNAFRSQDNIENDLIKTNMQKSIFQSGPLMTSKESYAEKKNDLIFYFEDQASRGVYKTRQKEVKEIDEITKEEKTVTRVEIKVNASGIAERQEVSPIHLYKIKLYNISIKDIVYSKDVIAQIKTQQSSIMAIQTAQANAKKAEQDVITTSKQGEAEAAKAKWEQEVIKAKLVTEAEQRNKVAQLDVSTAEMTKRKLTLEGEGEAAKKRAIMLADGALDQKLKAYVETQKYWAEAFSNYKGNVTPLYQSGGSGGNRNAALDFMEIMTANASKDLSMSLKNK